MIVLKYIGVFLTFVGIGFTATMLVLFTCHGIVSAQDHDPTYWQVDSVTVDTIQFSRCQPGVIFGSGHNERAWCREYMNSLQASCVDCREEYTPHYSRIPDLWEMRVDTTLGYYEVPCDNTLVAHFRSHIDTTWVKKRPVFLTECEREKLRRLLHGGIYYYEPCDADDN